MRAALLLVLLAWLAAAAASAEVNAYAFDDPAMEQQFRRLTKELRCPKCQNQSLADSDAPLAKDLRDIIYEKLKAGENEAAILAFMHKRYGDFIFYKPPVQPSTWLLWFGPAAFLVAGSAGLLLYVRRRRRQAGAPRAADAERLRALLGEAAREPEERD